MSSATSAHQRQRIPMGRLLAYCGLTFPIVAVGMPVTTFLPPLYAGSGGLGLATVGIIFMFARIWDVVSDPIVGILVDRYHWARGPRKTWIAFSVPMLCITALFLYMPGRGEQASAALVLLQLLVLYTGWTFLQTAHQAWGADLAPDYDERSRLFGTREIVNVCGSIFILALPAIVANWIHVDEYTEVAVMGWFLIVMLPIAVLIAFTIVPDTLPTETRQEKQRFDLREIYGSLRDRTLWRVLLIEIATGIGVGITSATFIFVARGVIGYEGSVSTILLLYFGASIFGIPLWLWLSRRFEKHTSLQIACLYSLVCNLLVIPILISGSTPLFIAAAAFLGLGFGAPQALLRSMMADQVDREEVRSGTNKAGFYFAFMGTSYKLGQASAVAIAFGMLAIMGFDPETPGAPEKLPGLIMVYTVAPALIFALCAILCHKYPVTRAQHEKDRAILEARAKANASQDQALSPGASAS
ncbi:MAG: MFS transporter [Hyphomonadaceae bacterium]|nr:MFS transporter [Hyphomonadaceae bacterium]